MKYKQKKWSDEFLKRFIKAIECGFIKKPKYRLLINCNKKEWCVFQDDVFIDYIPL